jgi:hypothetical protein
MSMTDFERCTPSEFFFIYENWRKSREFLERSEWERTRMICVSVLQPYSNKSLSGKDVMTFPWDEEQNKDEKPSTKKESREEIMKRFREAKKRAGLK